MHHKITIVAKDHAIYVGTIVSFLLWASLRSVAFSKHRGLICILSYQRIKHFQWMSYLDVLYFN